MVDIIINVTPHELKQKTALILGTGKTGISSAYFLLDKVKRIFLSDSKEMPSELEKDIKVLHSKGVVTEFGKNSDEFINKADLIIISPGIKPQSELVQKINSKNIKVISDIELGSYFITKPVIAVTGTNGKTTTTSLITHIINCAGKRAIACGNIGKPVLDALVNDSEVDYYVIEISSFQIFYSKILSPYIAVCLNITPDHLDWHLTFDNYVKAKEKLFMQQKNNQSWSVLNFNDPMVREFKANGRRLFFTTSVNDNNILDLYPEFVFYENENLCIKKEGEIKNVIHKNKLSLIGMHNIENCLASIACTALLDISLDKIRTGIQSFKGVEHRLELVRDIHGKIFFNDSKATNPEATIKAIEAVNNTNNKKVTLILGGRDKNTSLTEMTKAIKSHINEVILFGEAKERFQKELLSQNYQNLLIVNDLKEAINNSLKSKTDIVLFSPACASFDMFNNYEERGNTFKKLVQAL